MSDELRERCAERLQEAMDRADLTQAELSRETGIHQSMISQYCRGKRLPSLDNLLRLAEGTGFSVNFFLSTEGGNDE